MNTNAFIGLVLYSFVLFNCSLSHPLTDADTPANLGIPAEHASVYKPVVRPENKQDINIDASSQSQAHIEIPESVVEQFVKAKIKAFNGMQVTGEATFQEDVPLPLQRPTNMGKELPRPRACTINCGVICMNFGFHGGNCMGNGCKCY